MIRTEPFAEVIQSSLHGFMAQSWQWNQFPSFGSLAIIKGPKRTLYAIVYQINTGSMDPMRYPFAYQKTHEELLAEQPQIFEFLKTTFSCLTLGYQEKGVISYHLAPEPPEIHSFIQMASDEEAKIFFSSNTYLHLIFSFASLIGSPDELLLALLSHQKELGILKKEYMNEFMNSFSLLTGNDYRRLKLLLQRAQHMIDL